MHTLVNALVLQGKTPLVQVAAGDDDHDCKWSIFASWWTEKHYQRKLHSVSTILGTSIGAGCSNQMQVAKGKICIKVVPLCKLHLVAASRSYTCAQDGVDTVQLALVVFFLPPTSENTPLAVIVIITCCNLRWWCFSLEHALAHLLMCAQTNRHTLQLALCCGGGGCGGMFMWWL